MNDFLLFISLFGSRAKTEEQYKPVFLRPRQVTLISLSDSLAFFLSRLDLVFGVFVFSDIEVDVASSLIFDFGSSLMFDFASSLDFDGLPRFRFAGKVLAGDKQYN